MNGSGQQHILSQAEVVQRQARNTPGRCLRSPRMQRHKALTVTEDRVPPVSHQ